MGFRRSIAAKSISLRVFFLSLSIFLVFLSGSLRFYGATHGFSSATCVFKFLINLSSYQVHLARNINFLGLFIGSHLNSF